MRKRRRVKIVKGRAGCWEGDPRSALSRPPQRFQPRHYSSFVKREQLLSTFSLQSYVATASKRQVTSPIYSGKLLSAAAAAGGRADHHRREIVADDTISAAIIVVSIGGGDEVSLPMSRGREGTKGRNQRALYWRIDEVTGNEKQ